MNFNNNITKTADKSRFITYSLDPKNSVNHNLFRLKHKSMNLDNETWIFDEFNQYFPRLAHEIMQELMPFFESIRRKEFSNLGTGSLESSTLSLCLKHKGNNGNGHGGVKPKGGCDRGVTASLILKPVKKYKLPSTSAAGVKKQIWPPRFLPFPVSVN